MAMLGYGMGIGLGEGGAGVLQTSGNPAHWPPPFDDAGNILNLLTDSYEYLYPK